jgi:predicted flap endonuclease-1-like 5' DNA nuclease
MSPESREQVPLPPIGAPATRAFAAHGITRLDQLPAHSARELLALHGVGPKAIRILRESLAEHGLAFGDEGTS